MEDDTSGTALSAEASFEPEKPEAQSRLPYRGSQLSYRNGVTAISFDRSAEQTYNPYYAMSLALAPRWWYEELLQLSLDFTILKEITDSDTTTQDGETVVGDLTAGIQFPKFLIVPILKVDLTAGIGIIAPTSKASHARTMYLGLAPSFGMSRHFDVLSGIGLSYGFTATKLFHEYTTAQREAPLIPDCVRSGSCELYLSTGARNPSWRLGNAFSLSLAPARWLELGVGVAVLVDVLYPLEETDDSVSFEPQSSTDLRHTMAYGLEILVRPMQSLGVAIGAETVNPQFKPDSTTERPFFNRYTVLYLDLRLDFAGLTKQIAGGKEDVK